MFSARKISLALAGIALTTACQDAVPTVSETDDAVARPAFAVSSAAPTVVAVGQTVQLTSPHYKPKTGDFITLNAVILQVTEGGKATGRNPGNVKVVFKSKKVTDTVAVSVVAPSNGGATVASVSVALPMPSVSVGQIQTATATARDSTGAVIGSATTVSWSSTNTSVASVSARGAIDAIAAGVTTIKATIAGVTGTAQLTVPAAPSTPPSGASTASPAALPQVQVNVQWVQPTGKTITVAAGGNLQAALNSAQPGDEIVLQAGATFTGNFVLPAKPTGASNPWILVRSSGSGLPALGQRLTPRFASQLARVLSPNGQPTIKVAPSAHHWRLVGLEVSAAPGVPGNTVLVEIGDGSAAQTPAKVPSYITLDRVWVHGSPTLEVRRCVAPHGTHVAIVNSTINSCWSRGFDAQAIWAWNGPGPIRIENNYLEGSTENLGFGGAPPAWTGLVPSDIEIRGNHIAKPTSWKGGPWMIKSLIEFKNARRVLIENNLIEGNWLNGQQGYAVVFTPGPEMGRCVWCTVQDVTVRYNHIRRTGAGFNISSVYDQSNIDPSKRIFISNNLLDEVNTGIFSGTGRLFQLMNHDLDDLVITHNTGIGTDIAITLTSRPMHRLVITNNVLVSMKGYGIMSGNGKGPGTPTLNYHAASWTFAGNVLAGSNYFSYTHPAGNFYPASLASVGFVSATSLNYALGASPYRGKATDGTDPGADIPGVLARTASVVVP